MSKNSRKGASYMGECSCGHWDVNHTPVALPIGRQRMGCLRCACELYEPNEATAARVGIVG